MKSSIIITLSLFLTVTASANGSPNHDSQSGLLDQVRDLARQCVVQPYEFDLTGKRTNLPLQSNCSEIQEKDAMHARIEIQGEVYDAILDESEDSDGGDLDHLRIVDSKGAVVATLRNVAAFDNVLIALTGSQEQFPEIRVQ